MLLGLFLCFRFLPKWLVNMLLSSYITLLGAFAINAAAAPFAAPLFPPHLRQRVLALPSLPAIPLLSPEPTPLELTVPEAALVVPALALGGWYGVTKHWLANNALGIAFSLLGIEAVSLGSIRTGATLLAGLFVYDIFWVFCTPVMVSVARNFEAPIKLLFPRIGPSARAAAAAAARAATGATPPAPAGAHFAMLGLGDIVIPGLFLALLLRLDVERGFSSSYFQSGFWAYVVGLSTTIFVMNTFKAAQPALLYIVPALLGALAAHAALRGELASVWAYAEPDSGAAADAGSGSEGKADAGSNKKAGRSKEE